MLLLLYMMLSIRSESVISSGRNRKQCEHRFKGILQMLRETVVVCIKCSIYPVQYKILERCIRECCFPHWWWLGFLSPFFI